METEGLTVLMEMGKVNELQLCMSFNRESEAC